MKKILLLSALVIFSCSIGDDSSYSSNDNNDYFVFWAYIKQYEKITDISI